MNEIIVWVDYSSMDKYPREAYLTIEAARNKVSRWITLDPDDENYDGDVATEWKAFENGSRSFTCDECEFEFHRIPVKG